MTASYSSNNMSAKADAGSMEFVVRRSGTQDDLNAASSVAFSTDAVTAQAGTDFVATSGTVGFAPGETEQKIRVGVIDAKHEGGGPLTFMVKLNQGGAATGTILPSEQGNDPHHHDETDDVYEKHYSILVPRKEKNEKTKEEEDKADYLRLGTPNDEKNYINDTKSIEDVALKDRKEADSHGKDFIQYWFPSAGENGILEFTTNDRTAVALENSYEFTGEKASFYYGEKQEIVGDENKVEGAHKISEHDVILYDIARTLNYEARSAAVLEFDASLISSLKIGAEIEAKYGLCFESGLVGTVALKPDAKFEFGMTGGFESGIGEYVQQEKYALLSDEKLLLAITPSTIPDGLWLTAFKALKYGLVGLTHATNAVYLGFAATSIGAMESIQKDAKNLETYVLALRIVSGVQAAIGIAWFIMGVVYEGKIQYWLARNAAQRDKPFVEMDGHGNLTLSTGAGASIQLSGSNITMTADALTATVANNVVMTSTAGYVQIDGQTGARLESAAGRARITGVGVTSNSGAQPWTHMGAFNAGGAIGLGTVTAQSLNVAGTPVATTTDVANANQASTQQLKAEIANAATLARSKVGKLESLLRRLQAL